MTTKAEWQISFRHHFLIIKGELGPVKCIKVISKETKKKCFLLLVNTRFYTEP